jgi:hypothetical protein
MLRQITCTRCGCGFDPEETHGLQPCVDCQAKEQRIIEFNERASRWFAWAVLVAFVLYMVYQATRPAPIAQQMPRVDAPWADGGPSHD